MCLGCEEWRLFGGYIHYVQLRQLLHCICECVQVVVLTPMSLELPLGDTRIPHIATRVMGYTSHLSPLTSHLSPLDRSTVRICEMGGAGLQQLIEQIHIGAMQLDLISY